MLAYAWDCLDSLEDLQVGEEGFESPEDLYARILSQGTKQLIREGLFRTYNVKNEDLRGVKGKLDIGASLKKNLFAKGRAHCQFDELSFENPFNLIIHSTLHRLINSKKLSIKLKDEIGQTLKRMPYLPISDIRTSDLRSLVFNRFNSKYKLLISVCELIHQSVGLEEQGDESSFVGFLKEKRALNKLFEEFVYRFYKKKCEQSQKVSRPHIAWQGTAMDEKSQNKLPIMRTDIHIEGHQKVITIDTKFYENTFSSYKDKASIHSGNLYQIMAYLENLNQKDKKSNLNRNHEGVLLYPAVQEEADLKYDIWGYAVSIKTLDLSKDWEFIEGQLLDLVG
jgi:5-methylcytosine-specific restriction enzyme subunit McrC